MMLPAGDKVTNRQHPCHQQATMMLPAGEKVTNRQHLCHQQATSSVHYTTSCKQSSAPEDGRNYRLKHVELVEIPNKLLLSHLVGCLCYIIYSELIHCCRMILILLTFLKTMIILCNFGLLKVKVNFAPE